MTIYLVRHGETDWSLTGQHTGSTDLPLTPHGEEESRSLTSRLEGLSLQYVLVSPRLRARQTCELSGVSHSPARPMALEADLAEWNYGQYEGMTSKDIARVQPSWNIWRDGCPGGESVADVSARADRLIARVAALDGAVALFSHGHFSVALAVRWIGLDLIHGQHFALNTASLSALSVAAHHPDQRTIALWNERPRPLDAVPVT